MLPPNYKKLILHAKSLSRRKKLRGGVVKEVAAVLLTEKGRIFKGSSLNLYCGIGFCAEHSAIAAMISETDETHIRVIVAANKDTVVLPCGRCRELINLIDSKNMDTDIIISETKKIKLKKLLPLPWKIK
jgi:cytidine deaminase